MQKRSSVYARPHADVLHASWCHAKIQSHASHVKAFAKKKKTLRNYDNEAMVVLKVLYNVYIYIALHFI